ncbi:MAG: LysR family transcriptional regulator [Burkholderiales bacterium]|nr:LysR family transcriptional regulator [Burkholderiales bacterium]ODU63032.1 MAG: hypothetical protein ABT05_06305 [Lautropia sp. SCN 66-9]
MDSTSLYRFRTIVECGSLKKAAARLDLTQPALTRTLQALEAHYGVELLRRSSTGVSPTAYGEAVLKRAKLIDAELRNIETDVNALTNVAVGKIYVGAPSGVAFTSEALPSAARKMLAAAAQIEISCLIAPQHELLSALRQGALDFVLADLLHVDQAADLAYEFIFADRGLLVVRDSHPLANQLRINIGDLMQFPWAVQEVCKPLENTLLRCGSNFGLTFNKSVFRSNSALFMRAMVLQCDVVGLLGYDAIRADLSKGLAVELPLPTALETADLPTYRFGIIRRRDSYLSPPAQALIATLTQLYRRTP